MASLRARLLASVLVLSAVGLLVVGAVTYFEQRSFQLQRIDQQARSAPPAVAGALASQGIGPAAGDPDHDHGDRPAGGGPSPPPPAGAGGGGGARAPRLPVGTYGERRDSSGKTVGSPIVFNYGQSVTADPELPAKVPVGRAFTVEGEHGDPHHSRVFAGRDRRGSGTIVAAVPLREVDQTLQRLLAVEGLVIAGVLLLLGFAAWAVVRVGLLPLDRMGHTAGAIAGGDLSHRVESTDPRTEVGRLGIALNAMLDRLERAFTARKQSEDRLRQFTGDASHELRTPLASIRGYAELFRMGAARQPEDVEKAMRRIEDEAARMGVLVEDLLTLARLDEIADAPHTDVVLGALVADAADDARATAPDRAIESRAEGGTTVRGDAHQLRQVLANLLRNALVRTPAGTPIEVNAARDGGEVRLEGRDHGPGLPTDAPSEIFERFWRSEGGRKQGRAGAGLGLAIVAGSGDAPGGPPPAANPPDGGGSFVVRLPAA